MMLALALGAPAVPLAAQAVEDPPAIVALTLDTSGSIKAELIEQTRALAVSILGALPPKSEVALFVFDDSSRLILERTSDPEKVRESLAQVQQAGRFTALYDAIYDASRYLEAAPRSRKAVVLVTDGKDENSTLLQQDGLKVATDARIPVFSVGVGRMEEAVLARIAKLTGGTFTPMSRVDAQEIGGQIAALAPVGISAAPIRPAAASGPPPRPARSLPSVSSNLLILFGVAVFGVIAVLIALAFRLRPGGSQPLPAAGRPSGLSLTGVRMAGGGAADGETEAIDRTVVLRGLPALRVMSGPSTGRMLELEPGRDATIGRDASNDLEVADSSVSSKHCMIIPEGSGFVICDLQSTNGTRVNGERIERQRLTEGDVIVVGGVRITYGRG